MRFSSAQVAEIKEKVRNKENRRNFLFGFFWFIFGVVLGVVGSSAFIWFKWDLIPISLSWV